MTYSPEISNAIETWLTANARGSLRSGATNLSETFRKGGSSRHVDLASYITMRAPATYAAVSKCLDELQRRDDSKPKSLLDLGAGPGTASWAAVAAFPELETITMVDHHRDFIIIGQDLARRSEIVALGAATFTQGTLQSTALPEADLVTMSYALAEVAETDVASIIYKAWAAASQTLLIIEPGTPHGFKRIRIAREALTRAKATIVAPCTHQAACPLPQADWCHFEVRLQRSRAHMHAKAGTLPFEDEPFSYLIASRRAVQPTGARILRASKVSKFDVKFDLCANGKISTQSFASRDKQVFQRVKKLNWGDHMKQDAAAVLES